MNVFRLVSVVVLAAFEANTTSTMLRRRVDGESIQYPFSEAWAWRATSMPRKSKLTNWPAGGCGLSGPDCIGHDIIGTWV